MPIPVNSIVQIAHEYEHFNQRLMNITHWVVIDGGTLSEPSEIQAIADYFGNPALAGKPASELTAILPDTCTLVRTRAQVVAPTRTAYRDHSSLAPGTRGSSKSANVNSVITKRCDTAGRSEVGNFYLPGMDPADMNDGEITNVFKTDVEAGLTWLKTRQTIAVGAPVLDPVIWHRGSTGWSVVTSIVVQGEVRVMTRRTVGRGI